MEEPLPTLGGIQIDQLAGVRLSTKSRCGFTADSEVGVENVI